MSTKELQEMLDEIRDRAVTLAEQLDHLEPNPDTAGRVYIAIKGLADDYQSELKQVYRNGLEEG